MRKSSVKGKGCIRKHQPVSASGHVLLAMEKVPSVWAVRDGQVLLGRSHGRFNILQEEWCYVFPLNLSVKVLLEIRRTGILVERI
ncbi:hypothetical protein E2562_009810 [Oryza meyeriana var. granulata]|uniref:Uncharacterized protein n=1 Tax=Oryza meyeriana var. granulata TaxID=110450 RepID=A0A6G1BUN4_9ORYZ|nr:hypothetical protein E2562_009810 [Oryza meyeriana var. granulata]